MTPRRRSDIGVGLGAVEVPYDQSGGQQMPGMSVPEPGGTMKKMQFEFTDPAEAQGSSTASDPTGAVSYPLALNRHQSCQQVLKVRSNLRDRV
jgi:hypothetical protein